jgi:hypothetical protein
MESLQIQCWWRKVYCDGDKSLFNFVEKDRIRKVKLLRKDDNGRHLL